MRKSSSSYRRAGGKNQFSYRELPAKNVATLKAFYGSTFGWTHQDRGTDYATAHGSGLETGYNGAAQEGQSKALAMIETDDIVAIVAMAAEVNAAGGTLTVPAFAYSGGHRFHFTDPDGNSLSCIP